MPLVLEKDEDHKSMSKVQNHLMDVGKIICLPAVQNKCV